MQTLAEARYARWVRPLWPIERAVLEATAHDYPAFADNIRRQAETAQVTEFENSGAGFFSTVSVTPDAPLLPDKLPLDGAYGSVEGIEHGMGFVVFLEGGRLSLIEGYCHGNVSTGGVDFSAVKFDVKPWSASQSLCPLSTHCGH